ncbi:hypothetical protein ARMSODRAFT_958301, partial [Armillaria solidipes]
HEAHDLLIAHAQQKPVHKKRKGLRTICKSIILNHNILQNLANGGCSKANFNATKAWLTQTEEKNIVGIVKELKELVDEVCQTQLGDKFPVAFYLPGPPLGIKMGWCSQSYFK